MKRAATALGVTEREKTKADKKQTKIEKMEPITGSVQGE